MTLFKQSQLKKEIKKVETRVAFYSSSRICCFALRKTTAQIAADMARRHQNTINAARRQHQNTINATVRQDENTLNATVRQHQNTLNAEARAEARAEEERQKIEETGETGGETKEIETDKISSSFFFSSSDDDDEISSLIPALPAPAPPTTIVPAPAPISLPKQPLGFRSNELLVSTPIAGPGGSPLTKSQVENFMSNEETLLLKEVMMIPGKLNNRELLYQSKINENELITLNNSNDLLLLQYPLNSSVNKCMLDIKLSGFYGCSDFSIIRYKYLLNNDSFVSKMIGEIPKESIVEKEMWLLALDSLMSQHPGFIQSLNLPDGGRFLLTEWKTLTGYHFFKENSALAFSRNVHDGVLQTLEYEHQVILQQNKNMEVSLRHFSPENRDLIGDHMISRILNGGITRDEVATLCVSIIGTLVYFLK